jgi:hypothetical protein
MTFAALVRRPTAFVPLALSTTATTALASIVPCA